jgi:hypothetical protein
VVITDAEPDRLAPLTPPAPMGLRGVWVVAARCCASPPARCCADALEMFDEHSATQTGYTCAMKMRLPAYMALFGTRSGEWSLKKARRPNLMAPR